MNWRRFGFWFVVGVALYPLWIRLPPRARQALGAALIYMCFGLLALDWHEDYRADGTLEDMWTGWSVFFLVLMIASLVFAGYVTWFHWHARQQYAGQQYVAAIDARQAQAPVRRRMRTVEIVNRPAEAAQRPHEMRNDVVAPTAPSEPPRALPAPHEARREPRRENHGHFTIRDYRAIDPDID